MRTHALLGALAIVVTLVTAPVDAGAAFDVAQTRKAPALRVNVERTLQRARHTDAGAEAPALRGKADDGVEQTLQRARRWAHHSGAGFNSDKVIELTGTIKEFQFTNPHTWIQVIVEDDKGTKVEWSVEWGSPNSLGRQGIRPSTFPSGARVTMRLRPMLNGAPAGAFVGAKFSDGKTVGRWE